MFKQDLYILKQRFHSTDTTVDLSICMKPKYEKLLRKEKYANILSYVFHVKPCFLS